MSDKPSYKPDYWDRTKNPIDNLEKQKPASPHQPGGSSGTNKPPHQPSGAHKPSHLEIDNRPQKPQQLNVKPQSPASHPAKPIKPGNPITGKPGAGKPSSGSSSGRIKPGRGVILNDGKPRNPQPAKRPTKTPSKVPKPSKFPLLRNAGKLLARIPGPVGIALTVCPLAAEAGYYMGGKIAEWEIARENERRKAEINRRKAQVAKPQPKPNKPKPPLDPFAPQAVQTQWIKHHGDPNNLHEYKGGFPTGRKKAIR